MTLQHSLLLTNRRTFFIDAVQVDGLKKLESWFTNINTSGGRLYCKLDTGAEVSILPVNIYEKLQPRPQLHPTKVKLTAYGGTPIQSSGTYHLNCTSADSTEPLSVEFFVTPVDAQVILGLTDCVALGLIKRVCSIQGPLLTKELLQETYPTVFTGLGQLGTYHITLCDNHQPVINPPR